MSLQASHLAKVTDGYKHVPYLSPHFGGESPKCRLNRACLQLTDSQYFTITSNVLIAACFCFFRRSSLALLTCGKRVC